MAAPKRALGIALLAVAFGGCGIHGRTVEERAAASSGAGVGSSGGGGGAGGGGSGGGAVASAGLPGGAGSPAAAGAPAALDRALGRACTSDLECLDPRWPHLGCVTASEIALGGGAPPHGFCTASCFVSKDCWPYGPESLCHRAGDGTGTGYCFRGCNFGTYTPPVAAKCGRPDFACRPTQLWPDVESNCPDEACSTFDVCLNGTCWAVANTCLPGCRGDFDCLSDLHCDLGLDGGVCIPHVRIALPFGAACDPTITPDPCIGFCLAPPDSPQGYCSEPCQLGQPCAWNAVTARFDGVCNRPSALIVDQSPAADDPGACAPRCDDTSGGGCIDATAATACGPSRVCSGFDSGCAPGRQCFSYSTY